MAVAVASVAADSGWNGRNDSTPVTCSKPSGLEVGDLMIAHVAINHEDDTASYNVSTPGGWTMLGTATKAANNGVAEIRVHYKVADSGDVAASTFSWARSSGSVGLAVAIYRITGWGGVPISSGAGIGTSTGHTFENTITPQKTDCLLLFLYTATDNDSGGSVSSYAITNNNPTWTEHYDVQGDLYSWWGAGPGQQPIYSGASAVRSSASATGNSSCTTSIEYDQNAGVIVSIQEPVSVNVQPAVISLAGNIQAPSITGGANVTADPISLSASIIAPTPSQAAPLWGNQSKNSSSWTNQAKS